MVINTNRITQLSIMTNNPSQNLNESQKESLQSDNSNMKCKDGFCYLPNLNKEEILMEENINIFDPI